MSTPETTETHFQEREFISNLEYNDGMMSFEEGLRRIDLIERIQSNSDLNNCLCFAQLRIQPEKCFFGDASSDEEMKNDKKRNTFPDTEKKSLVKIKKSMNLIAKHQGLSNTMAQKSIAFNDSTPWREEFIEIMVPYNN